MTKKRRFLEKYSVMDLILIAMLTAIALAFKAIAGSLVRMITGPLGIPGGALIGGFYMLWLPLGVALVNKRGAAILISLVQSILLLITGLPGSHGIWTFFTYMIPSVAVELVMLFKKEKKYKMLHFLIAVMLANMIGTFSINQLIFRMGWIPLAFTLAAAAFSGVIGGIIGYLTYVRLINSQLFKSQYEEEDTLESKD